MNRLYKSAMLVMQCLLIAAVLFEGERIRASMAQRTDVADVRVVNSASDPIVVQGDVAVTGEVSIDGPVAVNGGSLKNGVPLPVAVHAESY